MPLVIAIDGPAASGKGTLARRLARHFGLRHLDTGAIYRAVGRDVLAAGGDPADPAAALAAARRFDPTSLDDPALRGEAAGAAASQVAAHPAVRQALLDIQRRFAATPPGAVLDGRDVGTVICPDAPVKLYVTASAAERARRRALEAADDGPADYAAILADIEARDARDAGRAAAPLSQAADAVLIDTSHLDADAAFARACAIVEAALGPSPHPLPEGEGN